MNCFISRRKATITDAGQYERLVIRAEVHFHVYSVDDTHRTGTSRLYAISSPPPGPVSAMTSRTTVALESGRGLEVCVVWDA